MKRDHLLARLRAALWLFAATLAAFQAWDARFTIFSDGLAYVDVADAYLHGHWHAAINGYWSPLYSWLIALALRAVRPSPYHEGAVVQGVNLAIYVFALWCFDFMLREVIRHREARAADAAPDGHVPMPAWTVVVVGYALFIWSSSVLITPFVRATPDMCVAGLVYLASAIVFRIRRGSTGRGTYAALGAVLGFAYLAKAVMFPLAFVFLAVGVLAGGRGRAAAPRALVALAAFLAVAGPFVIVLSSAKGRPTFGDTGRLNYAWYVNGVPWLNGRPTAYWEGQPAGSGTPAHPIKELLDHPRVYAFGSPVWGTYPPWGDPSYWYEGVRVRFHPGRQLRVLAANLRLYAHVFLLSVEPVFLIGLFILFWLGGRRWRILEDVWQDWPLFTPAVAALGLYALVHVEPRLIGPFVAIVCLALFLGVRLPGTPHALRAAAAVAAVIILTVGAHAAYTAHGAVRRTVAALVGRRAPDTHGLPWQVARALRGDGVQPGDEIAYVGDTHHFYWAHLAGVRVVAETRDVDTFWKADSLVKAQAFQAFRQAGAEFVLADSVPGWALVADWLRADSTEYYLRRLSAPPVTPPPVVAAGARSTPRDRAALSALPGTRPSPPARPRP